MRRLSTLLWIGHRAGAHGGPGGVVHRWALFMATACLFIVGWGYLATAQVFAERTDRIGAREPQVVQPGNPSLDRGVAWWLVHPDYYENERHIVIFVAPIDHTATPPPGLSRWPTPGEVFFSPALLASDRDGNLRQRYGRYGGSIDVSGLADPGERLAYFRPPSNAAFEATDSPARIYGFGVPIEKLGPENTVFSRLPGADWEPLDVYVLILFTVALPGIVLILVAVRSNSEQRDRRLAMLDAFGASPTARGWVLVGEAARPTLFGALLGGLLSGVTTMVDVPIPFTGYVVSARDLQPGRVWLIVLAFVVPAIVLGLVVFTQLRGHGEMTRPRSLRRRFTWLPRTTFPIAIGAAIWGATSQDAPIMRGYPVEMWTFMLGMLVALASLPSLIGELAGGFGRVVIAAFGVRRASAAALVAGRWLAAQPALVTRLCAAFVIGLGLLVQVQVQQAWVIARAQAFTGQFGLPPTPVGDSLVPVRTLAAESGADAFAADLGPDRVLRVMVSRAGGPPVVVGSCTTLGALGKLSRCPSSPSPHSTVLDPLSAVGQAVHTGTELSAPDFSIASATPAGHRLAGFFVLNNDGPTGVETVERAAYRELPKPYIVMPGQHAVAGSLDGVATYDWVLAFGLFGLVALALAGVLGAASIFLSQVHSLGPLAGYHVGRRLYIAIAGWNLALPLVMSGLVGAGVASFLGWLGIQIRNRGELSVAVLGSSVAVVVVVAVALTVLCADAASRTLRAWRPSND